MRQLVRAKSPQLYVALFIIAPIPRNPLPAEKTFSYIDADGKLRHDQQLPCWRDAFGARKEDAEREGEQLGNDIGIELPEVFMSLVVPAYNEQDRLEIMLSEAVEYLQREYGTSKRRAPANGVVKRQKADANGHTSEPMKGREVPSALTGWEIIIVDDGSTDKTSATALDFAAAQLGQDSSHLRVVSLKHNRGKGGAVTHGMRHVRGKYAVFADADGASKFEDLGKLVKASQESEDAEGRGVAVGSRAHLVGSKAVVQVRSSHRCRQLGLLTSLIALIYSESANAFFSSASSPAHSSSNRRYQGHSVRIQTFLAAVATVYHPIHALRRLDLRCRDADAG